MKNILVITSKNKPVDAMAEALKEWRKKYNIIAVQNEHDAADTLREEEIALLVCDFASRSTSPIRPLVQLLHDFPWIPCIAIATPNLNSNDEFLDIGVSVCFEIPFQIKELYRWTCKLLEQSNKGIIRDIPAHSILQMLNSEKKTCTLCLHEHDATGYLYIKHGEIIAAEYEDLTGEEAACSIIAGDSDTAEIKFYNMQRQREIEKTLMPLIMEAFRIKDEKESLAARASASEKTPLELKHFFTIDNPLRLEPGLQLKLEFENDTPLSTTGQLVGIAHNKYLIILLPKMLNELPTQKKEMGIAVKYLNSGCICMFNSQIVQKISRPESLLFIEYPQVVHYHELRRTPRASIYVPCIMSLASGQRYSSTLKDLSATGCLCQTKEGKSGQLPSIDNGTGVFLFCLFPGVGEEQEIQGVVRNVKKKGSELLVGIEFTEISSEIETIIASYLKSLEG